jgi:dephospho-CoA kinase
MSFVVGLTGGIGCGKSIASQCFSDLGVHIIDTDVIARTITQSNGQAINAIKNAFGDTYLTKDGSLDREKMRGLVFSDDNARSRLEKILHPIILNETIRQIDQARSSYVIVVVPLLFETKDYDHIVQRILVIDCDEQQQILRTMARSNLSEPQVKAIMTAQIARKERLREADDIIANNRDLDYLKAQVADLHSKYLSISTSNPRPG